MSRNGPATFLRAFWSSTLGHWFITLVSAAALFYFGYDTAERELSPRLDTALQEAGLHRVRAEELSRELAHLRQRVNELEYQNRAYRPQPKPEAAPFVPEDKVISTGRPGLMLKGKLLVSIIELGGSPRRARLHIKVMDGPQGETSLKPGDHVDLSVQGNNYRLTVKTIHAASIRVFLALL